MAMKLFLQKIKQGIGYLPIDVILSRLAVERHQVGLSGRDRSGQRRFRMKPRSALLAVRLEHIVYLVC
jgi:hypothetical protein